MRITLTKTQLGFIPTFPSDYENFQKIKGGEIVEVVLRKPRNILFHRKYFALLRLVMANLPERFQGKIRTEEDLLIAIKFAIGHTEKVFGLNGEVNEIPKSIDFEHMDEYEFEEFYNKTLDVLADIIGNSDLEQELINFY